MLVLQYIPGYAVTVPIESNQSPALSAPPDGRPSNRRGDMRSGDRSSPMMELAVLMTVLIKWIECYTK